MTNTTTRTDESQQQRSSPEESAGTGLAGKLSQGASEVTEHALDRAHRTRDRFQEELAQRRSRIGERLRDVSEVLGGAGRKLGDDDFVADGLHYMSEKIERVASYVEEAEPGRLADDLRGVVRERPAWFFGGAFLAGLALGRFARSSAEALAEGAEALAEGAQEAGKGAARVPRPPTGGASRAGTSARREISVGAQPSQAGGSSERGPGAVRPPVPGRDQGARQP